MELDGWRQIGNELYDRLHLPTYPVAIKFIRDPTEIPAEAVRPSDKGQNRRTEGLNVPRREHARPLTSQLCRTKVLQT